MYLAFVPDSGIHREREKHAVDIVTVLGGKIDRQRPGKFYRHGLSPCVLPAPFEARGACSAVKMRYAVEMTRTDKKVRYLPESEPELLTPSSAAIGVENVLRILEGRWKLVILFHLFGGKVLRFSDLERAIPAISQKMLIQQLRQMEADGIVRRIVHHQVPPKVEYCLTDWGQALCPALDALLKWAARKEPAEG